MSDAAKTTEPAIPVVAAIPVDAYRDLLQLAEVEIGGLSRTGVRLALDITEAGNAEVRAVATVTKVAGGRLDLGARVTFRGTPTSYGGYIQWTRED